jgi:molybdopterin-biosynthesis enzyme MoeA-like protein
VGDVHFVPGFPVMAWPMMESVLDQRYAHLFQRGAYVEKSVIVFGAMEATLTPLMEQVERAHPGIKVFSLPSVDHPSTAATSTWASRARRPRRRGLPALLAGWPAQRRSWAPNWCES